MAVQIGAKPDSGFDDPIGMLKDCHRRIERFVNLLARVSDQASGRALTIDERQAVEAALRYFRESGPRHNSDEEQSLFPRLKDMPAVQADITRLTGEHQEADELHAEIAELFNAWLEGQTPGSEDARGLREMTHRLAELYPAARFPPVTVVIGRGRPVAVGSPVYGVMVGLEALCGVKYFDADLEDRFVHVIAHEYVHVQQVRALVDDEHPTVLEASLIEGTAEFLAERIAGGVSDPGVWAEAKGRETEIETAFVPDEDKTDLSKWLYNGSIDKPGDLGYWVGYRIVKAYYQHAPDKGRAIRDILQMDDPKAFLARSGWRPGITLR